MAVFLVHRLCIVTIIPLALLLLALSTLALLASNSYAVNSGFQSFVVGLGLRLRGSQAVEHQASLS